MRREGAQALLERSPIKIHLKNSVSKSHFPGLPLIFSHIRFTGVNYFPNGLTPGFDPTPECDTRLD
jgi:hypothetical protein